MKLAKKFLLPVLLVLMLFALPFPVVSQLEENDSFCIACHTAPEQAYYDRAQTVANFEIPADLSSAHYLVGLTGDSPPLTDENPPAETFRCIQCHRGDDSLSHRWQTFLLGGRDTLIWLSGKSDETIEKGTAGEPELLNAACLKCHTDSILELGFNNHFHNQLPFAKNLRAQGLTPFEPPGGIQGDLFTTLGESDTSLNCLDCHQAHHSLVDGDLTLYLDVNEVVLPACVICHEEDGNGPLDLAGPGG